MHYYPIVMLCPMLIQMYFTQSPWSYMGTPDHFLHHAPDYLIPVITTI